MSADLKRVVETYQFLLLVEDAVRIFIRDAPVRRNDTREQALTKLSIQDGFDRARRKFSTYRWSVSPWTDATVDELFSELTTVFRAITMYQYSIR